MLSGDALASRRLLSFFSSHPQEPPVESLHRQKRSLFHSRFLLLLLFCLLLFLLSYIMSRSSLSFWEKRYSNLPPPSVNLKPTLRQTTTGQTTEPTSRPGGVQYHQAHPSNYHFVLDNPNVCREKSPFLVLMVPVEPKNVEARDAIRQTWGRDSLVQGKVVLTLFMLGLSRGAGEEKLREENLRQHDLIQSSFMDTYLNLTIKTMVIMDWLATRCSGAAYAMKVDSDMFLNTDNLVRMLQMPLIPRQDYLTGLLIWHAEVIRSIDSKWFVSPELYPDPLYPTYVLGMGYIFSNDLPKKFIEVSKSIKPFNIEDAYIGMCMKRLQLSPASPPDPSQFRTYSSNYDRCEFSKVITYILSSSEQLKNYWADYKKPGPHCVATL